MHPWRELLLGLAFCLAVGLPARAEQLPDAQQIGRADSYLALLDQGHYEQAWESMSQLFQALHPKPDWLQHYRTIRAAYGTMRQRQQLRTSLRSAYKNSPDGTYLIIQYGTIFAHKTDAVETVTLDCSHNTAACQVREYIIN